VSTDSVDDQVVRRAVRHVIGDDHVVGSGAAGERNAIMGPDLADLVGRNPDRDHPAVLALLEYLTLRPAQRLQTLRDSKVRPPVCKLDARHQLGCLKRHRLTQTAVRAVMVGTLRLSLIDRTIDRIVASIKLSLIGGAQEIVRHRAGGRARSAAAGRSAGAARSARLT
jgi:hypothetical protein